MGGGVPGRPSRWSSDEVVHGFARGAANPALLRFATSELARAGRLRAADIGCGAARNAAPLAALGADVVGIDLERRMLVAAQQRTGDLPVRLVAGAMHALPLASATFDLVVAHGIWNLARSGEEFRTAVAEAARVARGGAGLFVFTFSRTTLPAGAAPLGGETFVYDQFSGEPQCFLTEDQLLGELRSAGFEPLAPLAEHNRPRPGALTAGGPVIYEGTFRRQR